MLDHSTWIMNLTASNANPEKNPIWKEMYSARSQYRLTDFSPQQMDLFYQQLASDKDLFNLFFKYVELSVIL